jgi:large subunit ribosomal protein L25
MARHTVEAQLRSEFGNGPARRLRKQGLVPGVLYQKPGDSVAIVMDGHSLQRVLFSADGRSSVIDLTIDGGPVQPTVLTDWQIDPIRSEVQHVDFRPADDQEVATGEVARRREDHLEEYVAPTRPLWSEEDEESGDGEAADGSAEAESAE